MTYSFVLPCQAFSVNAYRYSRGFAKTKEAKEYEERFLTLIEEHKALLDMADVFKEQGGSFSVSIDIQYPRHIFYNQAQCISAKTLDVSNTEKPILDLLFNNWMSVDDRFVTEMHSKKSVGPTWAISISVTLLDS